MATQKLFSLDRNVLDTVIGGAFGGEAVASQALSGIQQTRWTVGEDPTKGGRPSTVPYTGPEQ